MESGRDGGGIAVAREQIERVDLTPNPTQSMGTVAVDGSQHRRVMALGPERRSAFHAGLHAYSVVFHS